MAVCSVHSTRILRSSPAARELRCAREGYDSDHIVELQLVKAWLNSTDTEETCASRALLELLDRDPVNRLCVPRAYNAAKGRLVSARLRGERVSAVGFALVSSGSHWKGTGWVRWTLVRSQMLAVLRQWQLLYPEHRETLRALQRFLRSL